MGAGQHTLRQSGRDARSRLPNGDSLHGVVENAPADRLSQKPSTHAGLDESTRCERRAYREGIRGPEELFLPIRAASEGRGSREPQEDHVQGDRSGSPICDTDGGYDSNSGQAGHSSGTGEHQGEGGHASVRKAEASGPRSSEEGPKSRSCFLDRERQCAKDCAAYDEGRNTRPCLILYAIAKPSSRSPTLSQSPPKVSI